MYHAVPVMKEKTHTSATPPKLIIAMKREEKES